ncbi:hypothetical protein JDFnp1_140 [Fusobacterium phage JD-Fnp1]|nr:hypothetical protein JDFnp1_140 [Fusobacterium phage JD-Fnp1]
MSDEYIEKEILKYIGQIQGVGYTKGLKLKDYQKKKDRIDKLYNELSKEYKKKNQKGLHMMFKFLDEFEKNYNFKSTKPAQSSIEDIMDFYNRLTKED